MTQDPSEISERLVRLETNQEHLERQTARDEKTLASTKDRVANLEGKMEAVSKGQDSRDGDVKHLSGKMVRIFDLLTGSDGGRGLTREVDSLIEWRKELERKAKAEEEATAKEAVVTRRWMRGLVATILILAVDRLGGVIGWWG